MISLRPWQYLCVSILPCFENLPIAYCEHYRKIFGYGCQRSEFFVTVAVTWSIFFVV